MAFDILNAGGYEYSQSSPPNETWEDKKAQSLKIFEEMIEEAKAFELEHNRMPNGRQKQNIWVRSNKEATKLYIGWKIGSKFVWFKDRQNFYECSSNWESDIRSMAQQVRDGRWDQAIEECFNRPSKTKKTKVSEETTEEE